MATFIEQLCGGLPHVTGVKKALRCQKAEQTYAGVPCGIMDQFISAMGCQGHLLLIDCRSNDYTLVPFCKNKANDTDNTSPVVVITNTNVKHSLGDSAYPIRVKECKEAVSYFQNKYPELKIETLRDVTLEMLDANRTLMEELAFKRAKHCITENARTLLTVEALKQGDYGAVGTNMTMSHTSLSDDFEVHYVLADMCVLCVMSVCVGELCGIRSVGGIGLGSAWRVWIPHDRGWVWRMHGDPH